MGKKGRVFVRGLTSETYGLGEFRKAQLAAERVRDDSVVVDDAKLAHSGDSEKSRTWWRIGPGDEDFLTQTLQVHFVELPGQSSNHGHGHQNEAAFYILEGAGYEIHDDQRYDWKKGDLVFVHTDSVHRHFNPYDEKAVALVVKAKCTWMFMGLIQQGRSGPIEREDEFGPREDWSKIWTEGVLDRKKVVTPEDMPWEMSRQGLLKHLINEAMNTRMETVDAYMQIIPPGSRSGRHRHLAEECLYVLEGRGYDLHQDCDVEITDTYHWTAQDEVKRFDWEAGDVIYVPPNTIHQHFNADPERPVRLISAINRIFKQCGLNDLEQIEDAPEYDPSVTLTAERVLEYLRGGGK